MSLALVLALVTGGSARVDLFSDSSAYPLAFHLIRCTIWACASPPNRPPPPATPARSASSTRGRTTTAHGRARSLTRTSTRDCTSPSVPTTARRWTTRSGWRAAATPPTSTTRTMGGRMALPSITTGRHSTATTSTATWERRGTSTPTPIPTPPHPTPRSSGGWDVCL